MNLDDLQKIWNSSGNQPSPADCARMTDRFARTLLRKRRFQAAWLGWTFFSLISITGFVGWLILGTDKVDLKMEWGVVTLLAVPWAFAFHFLRQHLGAGTPSHQGDAAIVDALRTAREAIRTERRNLKLIGILYLIIVPWLALTIFQLHAAEKMTSSELLSLSIVMAGVLVLSAVGIFLKGRHLLPQQEQLDSVLAQFNLSTKSKKS